MRPTQFLLREKKVTEIKRILKEEFINPFGVGYEHLYNLSSGEKEVDDLPQRSLMYVKMVLE